MNETSSRRRHAAPAAARTGRRPAPSGGRPRPADLVDAGFLLALTALALLGLRTTYSGSGYLLTGLAAAAIGIGLSYLSTARRWPVLISLLLLVIAYFLFGGLLVLRSQAPGGVAPSGSVLSDLATGLIHVWRQLLTTLPPVAGNGPLLLPAYLIGLITGGVGFLVARRWSRPAGALLLPLIALAAVILLGTVTPAARIVQGVGFGVVALAWLIVRAQRRRPGGRAVRLQPSRIALSAGMIAVAGVGAWQLGPQLPGHDQHRVVLRNYVTTPFDIAQFPSPLVGFRAFTKDANVLYDQPLFHVAGLPTGQTVQLATLDSYNGSVWTATNATVPTGPDQPLDAFQRVGSRIETGASGAPATVTVTIDAAYADSANLAAWLPMAGTADSIKFSGPDAAAEAQQFRYNLATGSGVVAGGLPKGASYTVSTLIDNPTLPADAAPAGTPTLSSERDAFVSSRADQWSVKISGVVDQVQAVARYLRQHGAYSDGGPGQTQYLPGHSVGRLTSFLNAPQLVGDDEQYAATFALMSNYLGLPARVVLAASPEADGTVEGKDVQALVQVEVRSSSGSEWVTIPRSQFMPDQTKTPDKQPPQTVQNAQAAVVPPPNPVQPPNTLDQVSQPDQNVVGAAPDPKTKHQQWQLPGWVRPVLEYAGIPILALLVLAGLIVAAKSGRRRRRRRRGTPAQRLAMGWRELLDYARDFGTTVPVEATRREQATAVGSRLGENATATVLPLARAADAGVFGPTDPQPQDAESYWRDVDSARRGLRRGRGFWSRIRAAISLRSWRRAATS
jgi:hypothetical protein